jgi:adenylosuccinate lyase
MIERYSRPEMAAIWSDEGRLRRWLEVELAVCDVLAERGEIPAQAARTIRARAGFDAARIAEIEAEVRHDVIAFLTNVAEHVGPEARFVHFGMTSSDVIDTALALQIRDAGALLAAGAERLAAALLRRAQEHRRTPMVGRTHGVHAEPTTFGLKLLVLHEVVRRGGERLARATRQAAVGKISGAVGTFAHLDPQVEEAVCARLGIGFEAAATQVVQRDRHAEWVSALALLASVCDQLAVELRHLARTEVREVEEEFGKGQKGSSAMPHKRNPWRLENVSGLARVVRGHAVAALENLALWHERDISNSSAERIVLPDASGLLDFMLQRLAGLVETLVVHPERMRENLELSRGLVFSGALLLELARKGLSREDAYRLVQRHAMETWERGGDFRERVLADPAIAEVLAKEEIDRAFDLGHALRHVDAIFERTLNRRTP